MSQCFKIAVIGCGQLVFSHHGLAYHKYAVEHPGTILAACCDLDAERSERFKAEFGFERSYCDWKKMISQEEPDVVCLNVPPTQTAALSCEILRMGVPLLLEKPPGMNEREVNAMIRAADESGTPNAVAFNRRTMPLMLCLKAMVKERFLSDQIHHINYNLCRIGRTDPDFSTTAIHGIDAVSFIAGSDYAYVRLRYRDLIEYGSGVANILMDCAFRSGATAKLSFCPLSGLVIERAEVYMPGNACFLNTPIWNAFDYPGLLTWVKDGEVVECVTGVELTGSREDYQLNGFYQEDAAFFDTIRRGETPVGDIRSGRQAVIIAQAVRERREEVVF